MIKKLILPLILTLSALNPIFSSDFENLWGVSKSDLISRLKLENYSTFKPEENPEYSNRVINFFSSMNSDGKTVITILRTTGKPETDYCFFNERLYSISEEWNNIEKARAQSMLKNIREKYTEISAGKKDADIIFSFKKNRTKVLVYKKVIDEKSVSMKIFYYSMDLFGMLLNE